MRDSGLHDCFEMRRVFKIIPDGVHPGLAIVLFNDSSTRFDAFPRTASGRANIFSSLKNTREEFLFPFQKDVEGRWTFQRSFKWVMFICF